MATVMALQRHTTLEIRISNVRLIPATYALLHAAMPSMALTTNNHRRPTHRTLLDRRLPLFGTPIPTTTSHCQRKGFPICQFSMGHTQNIPIRKTSSRTMRRKTTLTGGLSSSMLKHVGRRLTMSYLLRLSTDPKLVGTSRWISGI